MATSMKLSQTRKVTAPCRRSVVAHAQADRRAALAALAAVPALLAAKPSQAAYGDGANVFGKLTNKSGFIPYTGDGFALLVPSKYNPSKEETYKGTVLRYEDNGDTVNNISVMKLPSSKGSIESYGDKDAFLKELQSFGLFGKQAYTGQSKSEGGFADGRYAAASIIDVSESKDKKGRNYYQYQLLVRAADGNEGGRHQLVKATVGSDGNLYIIKCQVGDKRWFKGAKKEAVGALDSFIVA